MPNIAPRGLFARSGSAWKPPVNVLARVAGVWKQADYVWAYHNGAWQLVWGRVPATPATATATWVQPSTVRIDWTAPAINPNTQWIVRRSDNSIVGTVPVETLTIIDTRPLISSIALTNSTVPAYTVEGSDGTVSSATRATNTVTYNLTPASLTTSLAYPNASTGTVTLNWTPNATYGQPQGWQAYLDGSGFVGSVLPGTATTTSIGGQGRGYAANWRIVPMTQNAAGTWIQAGNVNPVAGNIKAADPTGVTLTAVGLNTLRLSWNAPSGAFTGFEVQTYVSSWQALGTTGSGTRAADWTTSQTGYMRVRTLSAGGPSDWVQAGPVTPVTDATGPGPSSIQSWMPEASYGRMVVRATASSDSDTATAQIFCNTGGAGWASVWGPTAVSPGQGLALNACNGSAGQQMGVIVRTWDRNGNMNTADAVAYYNLAAPSVSINPTDGWTARNAAWRNDGVAGQYSLVHGATTAGVNVACVFYGAQLYNALIGRTFVSGNIYYSRLNDQGANAPIQPGLILHTGQDASAIPGTYGPDVYGSAVARTGTVSGNCAIPSSYASALAGGGYYGLGFYRGDYGSTDPNNAASLYMKLYNTGAVGPDGNVCGLVVLSTLG